MVFAGKSSCINVDWLHRIIYQVFCIKTFALQESIVNEKAYTTMTYRSILKSTCYKNILAKGNELVLTESYKKKWKYNFLHLQNVVMFISYTILQIYVFKLRVINFNTGWVRNVPKIICDVCSLAISQILLTLNAYLIYHLLWIAKTNVYLCIVTNFQNWITWYLDSSYGSLNAI